MDFSMGVRLRAEIDRQLLQDLTHYGISPTGLWIDWSDSIGEGHCSNYLGGFCKPTRHSWWAMRRADGWMDFIHGGAQHPLFVFWLFLSQPLSADDDVDLKEDPHIPAHIWARLPESSKRLCSKRGEYDAAWKDDPLVLAWLQAKKRAYFARASAPVRSLSRQPFNFLTKWFRRGGGK